MKNVIKDVVIVDTKAGNLFSLQSSLERLGYCVTIESRPSNKSFDAVIVPGQGRFGTVMKNISANGWVERLAQLRDLKTPIFGICVGMQIFFESSEEDPGIGGIGWFKGEIKALDFPKKPMVGWSKVTSLTNSNRICDNQIVYFVNSYALKDSSLAIAKTKYGETFCAAVENDNLIGVQFHPEKSSEAGAQIIRQSLERLKAKQLEGHG